MSQENIEALRGVFKEWSKGNLRPGVELYDENVVWVPLETLPDPGVYLGVEAMAEWNRHWLRTWTDYSIEALEFIDAGDSVVVEVLQRARGKMSTAATEIRIFWVWSFRGPKVIRTEQFADKSTALEAVGMGN